MLKFHAKKSYFVTHGIYVVLIMHSMTAVVSQCVDIPQRKKYMQDRIFNRRLYCKALFDLKRVNSGCENVDQEKLSPIHSNR